MEAMNMKKAFFFLILIIMMVIFPIFASGAENAGDFQYTLEGSNAVIVRYSGSKSYVEIPTSIDGHPVTSIGAWAFFDCQTLKSIVIPSSIISIGDSAFSQCYKLDTVHIYDGLSNIGNDAFSNCDSLTCITIPNSVISIGQGAFSYCDRLTDIKLPDSLTIIEDNLFAYCKSLSSIEIPGGVTEMGFEVFSNCTSLSSVSFPDTLENIGYEAFKQCVSITSIVIPDSIKYIVDGAFLGCVNLSSVILPKNLKGINDNTFTNCSSLASISIPDSVTSIGNYAFCACTSLENVVIPKHVESIGDSAFELCVYLKSIEIPESVISIGIMAFYENSQSLIITGVAGSYAQQYAENENILFNDSSLLDTHNESGYIEGNLLDLIVNGTITANIIGDKINVANISLTNNTNEEVKVFIGFGTYFLASISYAQDLLVTSEYEVLISPHGNASEIIETACMEIEDRIPDSNDCFSVRSLKNDSDLRKVLPIFKVRGCSYAVMQAVVWMITDNASFSDLGKLTTSYGSRYIVEDDYNEAMDILVEAGLRNP
jgi:prefoldin subunit 5